MSEPPIKCLLTRKFWDQDLGYLRANVSPRIEFVLPEGYSPEALVRSAAGAEIFLGDVPDAAVLDAAKELRLIQIPWTGVDLVDFGSLRSRAILVCNSHSNSRSVAELGMALLLACFKQIPAHDAALRRGDWRRPGSANFAMPDLLGGKTVGLLGFGAVGRQWARMLSGFEVVLRAMASSARSEGSIEVAGPDQLDRFCAECDILLVSLALTPQTKGMLGKRQFSLMKPTAYVINLSRAAILEEEPFYEALKTGQIAGAGVDVWYQYPRRGESAAQVSRFPFADLPNVVLSPHRGGLASGELPHLVDVVENLNRWASGQPPMNRVDCARGY